MKQPPPPTFQAAARRAVRRLLLARCLRLLGATAAPVFLTATALLVAWRLGGGRSSGPLCAGGVVLAWLLATALWAWLQRPTPAGATAAWDARAGRHEAFLSALCFEARPGLDDGERLHLAAQQRKLADGLAGLHRLIPLAVSWMLLLPVGFLGFSVSGLLVRPLPAEDRALDAEARRRAADEAGDLDRQSKKLDRLEQLDEKEQEAVEQLKASLDEAAEKLKGLDKETQRDVLTDLERRARQAEKLADSLGAGQACFRSSPMIAELARHAETADLANALRASDLEQTAHEATTIADGLRSPECTIEKHQRLQHALSKALGAADENDRRTLVARRLEPARKHLEADDRPRAAEEFDRIAEHFMRASQRVEAQRRLRRLAGKLRNAGQRIFGRRLRTMERLPQRLARNADMLPRGYWPPGQRPRFHLPPWMGPLPKDMKIGRGTPRWRLDGFPVPGQGGGACPGGGLTPVPGSGNCPGSAGATTGGLHAGVGSAPYGKTPTQPFGATSTKVVGPTLGRDGDSEARFVQGRDHREETARSASDIAIQFIRAEEEALAEEPLPLTRREQVLRYFTALRRQLEDEH